MKKTLAVTICALIGLTLILSFYMYRNETDRRLAYLESDIASLAEEKEEPAAPVFAADVETDPTLSIPGSAADAGATGEALARQMDILVSLLPDRYASAFSWEFGKIILSDGTVSEYNRSALSGFIPVEPFDILMSFCSETDAKGREVAVYLASYADGVFLRNDRLAYGVPYIVEQGVTDVRLSCTYTPQDDVTMTGTLLRSVFCLKFKGSEAHGDGSKPIYVAFGASTTAGAVHHYSGTGISYSTRNFPDYIGDILGLETYNESQGTTGFMARAAGKAPNFMDSIYMNDEVLSQASLITIMFGYGNDKSAGLPVGEWDDYYPYDQDGYFFVSGGASGNKRGLESMLDRGATLFGCLNWSIKWIGEHYPKAQLIVIYGAPSGNAGRPAVIEENAEDPDAGTRGHSPLKVSASISESEDSISAKLEKLRTALNIPIIDLQKSGLPFSYYSTYAKEEDGSYAVFSTKGTPEDPVWNSHPSEEGYLLYARYLAGRISEYFMH